LAAGLVLGSVALASTAVAWFYFSGPRGDVHPVTSRTQRNATVTTLTPAARHVALTFIRAVASKHRADARKVIDRTFPCGKGRPPAALRRGRILPTPSGWTYNRNDVVFEEAQESPSGVFVVVTIHTPGGPGGAYGMGLSRHGRPDKWRVNYWDTEFGAPIALLCQQAQT
jgi:hypothetical protein